MGGILGILKNGLAIALAWLQGKQREEDKKTGARQVENKQMKEGIDAAKEAKRIRKDNPKRSRREHLDRL